MRRRGSLRAEFVLLGVLAWARLSAQDPHFSQVQDVPMLLNPAFTAAFDSYRASVNYRTQWRAVTTPFITLAASYEQQIDLTPWQKEKSKRVRIYHPSRTKPCVGIQLLTDKAGDGNYKTTLALLTVAKSVQLNAKNTLGAGLQGGVVQHSINTGALLWPDQFDGTAYASSLPSGETFGPQRLLHGDFSAGMVWAHGDLNAHVNAKHSPTWVASAAVYHVNRARHSFFANSRGRDYMKLVLHSRARFELPGGHTAILPDVTFSQQGKQQELLVGAMFGYRIGESAKFTAYQKSTEFLLGLHYRSKDALILNCLLEFDQLAIGFSYDATVSQLREPARTGGGIEVMVRYSASHVYLYQNK
jgi:type IX secretion system PorP/SprF family membrane protein